ncbi:MAG TPA: hypothetical protein VH575_03235 [Gemmataceae bacterium]
MQTIHAQGRFANSPTGVYRRRTSGIKATVGRSQATCSFSMGPSHYAPVKEELADPCVAS